MFMEEIYNYEYDKENSFKKKKKPSKGKDIKEAKKEMYKNITTFLLCGLLVA